MRSDSSDRLSPPAGSVRLIQPSDPDYRVALALVLTNRAVVDAAADRQIDGLNALARRQGLGLDLMSGGYAGGRLIYAVLAIESPGRTAMVYAPTKPGRIVPDDLAVGVLATLRRAAGARGVALLQALLVPGDESQAKLLQQSGFSFLTELIYMDRGMSPPFPSGGGKGDLGFVTFSDARRALFEQAVEATYVDSLDCPALSGLRKIADVVESHRATGVHDPAGWYVALRGDEPVGVLLTSRVSNRTALEVVYMGVSPRARGQGVGDRLMALCAARAQQVGVESITLAVDATNEPARRLYDRWGFEETGRRRAWIASPAHDG